MRSALQLLGGVAVAGAVATGSTAFTAAGLSMTAPTDKFVGGTVTQTVSGTVLSDISYTFANPGVNTIVASFVLTFADDNADGKTPTVALGGGSLVGSATAFTCTAVPVTANTAGTSTCTAGGTPAATLGYSPLTSVAVTIAPSS